MSPVPAAPRPRPEALALDVLDTLFPLAPMEWRFREAGIPRVLMTRWCDHLLRDAFALALSGGRATFEEVVRGALHDITGSQIAPSAEEAIVDALTRLDPRPEAVSALNAARAAGLRVITLGNGGEEETARLLERSNLLGLVEAVLGGGGPHAWKPAPEPYLAAARALDLPPDRVALVSAHGWDVAGARRAGLWTGWSSHLEGRFPSVFPAPDVSGNDLGEVVEGLLNPEGVTGR